MPKSGKGAKEKEPDLWIAPRNSPEGPASRTPWECRPHEVPSANRILELADLALGLKRAEPKRKRTVMTHATK
jgi:hypothetical protein